MSDKNIFQRINAVMQEIEYVKKDADVSAGAGGRYKAVTHDAVVGLVRKKMVKAGIVVRLEQTGGKILQYRDGKDIKQHFYRGRYTVWFVNIDHPQDCLPVQIEGHAMDTQDKAPGKAASYAVKYAMLKTFSIETGENEESRYFEGKPYTEEQAAVYHDLIEREQDYEFYMFTSTLPEETAAALYNSFPEGKKQQGKKRVTQMLEQGRSAFLTTVEELQKRLAEHDPSALEITDEMDAMEKRLLMKYLSNFEIARLKAMREAAE